MANSRWLGRVKHKVRTLAGWQQNRLDPEPEILYRFYVDSPSRSVVPSRKLLIRGWVFTQDETKVKRIRVKNAKRYFKIDYGIRRKDVERAFVDVDSNKTKNCGFLGTVSIKDGPLSIQVDFGEGYREIASYKVKYSSEKIFEQTYNPHLAINLAEHENLLANKKRYYFEEAHTGNFARHDNDPRLIAFYLPQFHPIAENDQTWGKGFTEWANVTAAKPRFIGHQQPILPADLGFYDLRLEDNLLKQIQLAKKYGLHGFCFYYYWFSGQKLLQTPLENFLKRRDWDFNFMICWANENWTKRWDGRSRDVIIAQKYLASDPLNFIRDVEHILLDPRYIRQNGKPLLAIYRGSELGDTKKYIRVWRDYFRDKHSLELEIITMLNFDLRDPRRLGFDGGIEFTPQTDQRKASASARRRRVLRLQHQLLDADFNGMAVDYRHFALLDRSKKRFKFPTYKCVSPSWDNEPRRSGQGSFALYGANPDLYAHWLNASLSGSKEEAETPVFINAWNEWAESAILEPSREFGHSWLRRTAEVMARQSLDPENQQNFPYHDITRAAKTKLAVVVHIFYESEWRYIKKRLATLKKTDFDLFLTITQKDQHLTGKIKAQLPGAYITLVPNRGRDVLPFLTVADRLRVLGYEYVLKLHTKKSSHRQDGRHWFEQLIDSLLPSPSVTKTILEALEKDAAIIGPAGHFVNLDYFFGDNEKNLLKYLSKMYSKSEAKQVLESKEAYGFFAGTMFWCRLDAIKPLLDLHLIPEDFEAEKGQLDGTLAHACERIITLLPIICGQPLYESSPQGVKQLRVDQSSEYYKFAERKTL